MRLRPIPDCPGKPVPFLSRVACLLHTGEVLYFRFFPSCRQLLSSSGTSQVSLLERRPSERMLLSIQASEVMPWWGDTWQFSSACPEGASVGFLSSGNSARRLGSPLRIIPQSPLLYSRGPPRGQNLSTLVATGSLLRREFVCSYGGPGCGCGESAPSWKVQSTPRGGTVRFQEVCSPYPLHRIVVVPRELLSASVYAIVLGGQSRVSDGVVVARTCRRSCTGSSLRREFVARGGPGCGCEESAPSWKVQSTPRGVQYVSRRFGAPILLHRIVVCAARVAERLRVRDRAWRAVPGSPTGVVQRWISVGEGGGG